MPKKVERTAPGSKNDWRITYSRGSKKWTNDRPGDGKGDPEEVEETFDDLTVKRGLKRLETAVNGYIRGKGSKAIQEAVEALEQHAGKDAARTAIRKLHSMERTELEEKKTDLQEKVVEGLDIAKKHLNRDRKKESRMKELKVARELVRMAKELTSKNWVYKWNTVKKIISAIESGRFTVEKGAQKMAKYLEDMSKRMSVSDYQRARVDMDEESLEDIKRDLEDNIIEEFKYNVDDESGFDYALSQLYDWGDAYSVWLGL